MERLKKMIETLTKMAREGLDNEQTRRLARNLGKIAWLLNVKKITGAKSASVIAKQSLQSAVETSAALVADIEKLALLKNLATKPVSLADEVFATQWQEDI